MNNAVNYERKYIDYRTPNSYQKEVPSLIFVLVCSACATAGGRIDRIRQTLPPNRGTRLATNERR